MFLGGWGDGGGVIEKKDNIITTHFEMTRLPVLQGISPFPSYIDQKMASNTCVDVKVARNSAYLGGVLVLGGTY